MYGMSCSCEMEGINSGGRNTETKHATGNQEAEEQSEAKSL